MPIKLCTSIALHIRNLIIYENGTTYRSWHIHGSWQQQQQLHESLSVAQIPRMDAREAGILSQGLINQGCTDDINCCVQVLYFDKCFRDGVLSIHVRTCCSAVLQLLVCDSW